jgi:hypothetical protein
MDELELRTNIELSTYVMERKIISRCLPVLNLEGSHSRLLRPFVGRPDPAWTPSCHVESRSGAQNMQAHVEEA